MPTALPLVERTMRFSLRMLLFVVTEVAVLLAITLWLLSLDPIARADAAGYMGAAAIGFLLLQAVTVYVLEKRKKKATRKQETDDTKSSRI